MKIIPTTKEWETQGDVISHFIKPGGFFFHESNCRIHTILGSCVAITLWHPVLHIGGMCHFILPGSRGPNIIARSDHKLDGRYSDEAMALFEIEANRYGTKLEEYQAKVFGGSNMLTSKTLRQDELIGMKNTESATKHLIKRGIPLLAAHVGEAGHRRIAFDIETGVVWVRHVPLKK